MGTERIRFDRQKNIVYIRLEGEHSEQTILAAAEAAMNASEYRPGMNRLWDVRDADLSALSSSRIWHLARYSAKFPRGVGDAKVAVLVKKPLEYGLARMVEAYGTEGTIGVFRSLNEAEAWLTATSAD